MSDYRDIIKNAIENGIILDSCGSDERHYVWGRYIDLCEMAVEDAIPLGPEDCGGGKPSKTKNTITLLMAEGSQGTYTLHVSLSNALSSVLNLSFTMDGEPKLVEVPAGVVMYDTNLTGENQDKPYSVISNVTFTTEDTEYTLKLQNNVKSGIFALTINNNGEQTKENVKYGTVYTLPTVAEKPGYDYIWKDNEGSIITGDTITMPEKDYVINGSYVIKSNTLSYTIVEYNYMNGEVVSSTTSGSTLLAYGTNIYNILSALTPEKDGHTLVGWKYTPDGTSVLTGATMPDNDVEVYNAYNVNQYVLTYVSDGSDFKKETYYFNQEIVPLSENPEKEGYTFNGWDKQIPQIMPSNNITVNAQFTINEYKLTYFVDGAEIYADTYKYGAAITPRQEETREGYTFSGWSEIPQTMPANNVDVFGTFSINSHTVAFYVDGVIYYSAVTEYGNEIVIPREPSKEGYTFSGWGEVPETMPDENVSIYATFIINQYSLNYYVDNVLFSSVTYDYGTIITPIEEPIREGYTFSGWGEIPYTMPANDVSVYGSFAANQYTLTYYVDNELYSSFTYSYNEVITPIEYPPHVEGYTFSGWDNVPARMPSHDVEVRGIYSLNSHTLRYFVDGTLYSSITYNYGETIVPLPDLTKVGYTFSGWSEIPQTMPDNNVVVNGAFSVNQYTLTFIVDGEPYTSITANYGSPISVQTPSKEGYTFSGWNAQIPSTMPAENRTYIGSFAVNHYSATYFIEGAQYSSVTYAYGDNIVYPDVPRSGYTLVWDKQYLTMPAFDITINGIYEEIPEAKTIYYNAIFTKTESGITNVSGMSSFEYDSGVKTETPFVILGNAEEYERALELDEEEFDEWCAENDYSFYIAAPTNVSVQFFNTANTEVTNKLKTVGEIFKVNGVDYQGYSYDAETTFIDSDQTFNYKTAINE